MLLFFLFIVIVLFILFIIWNGIFFDTNRTSDENILYVINSFPLFLLYIFKYVALIDKYNYFISKMKGDNGIEK
jgi:membrane protease YdiL (CAAX protease family)